MRRPRARLAPLLALLFSCIFLLNLVSSLGVGQLAAYSETRSFRDALEGRSMEEAISGPVDKDTSSYGDRTSAGGGGSPTGSSQQASRTAESGSGSNYGGSAQAQAQGEAPNSNAGQMMINIPANGNLNPMTTQQRTSDEPMDEQQQSSANGGAELEREAGPISPDFPIDTHQMAMEQKAMMMMMMKAKQMLAGRSGRLTAPAPSSATMMDMMMRTMKEEAGRRKPMNRMGARSGRLQQEQQEDEQQQQKQDDKSDEENKNGLMNGPAQMAPANSYGKKIAAPTANRVAYDSNMQNSDVNQQQQANGSQESGYENQSEQEEMSGKVQQMSRMGSGGSESMRAKYVRMMNGAGMDTAYKRQQANMGQSMMMSLANKAAYMANQKSQRQVAPMMMMGQQNGDGATTGYKPSMPMSATMGGGSYGQNGGPMPMPMKRANYQSMGATGAMRAMRRANQRRAEKKISPAMMNAMLNRMLASSNGASDRQYQAEEPTQKAPAASGDYSAGQLMNKMRADMMAQMMMMKMNTVNGNSYGSGAMSSSSGNSNKLYNMMSTMQQQQQQQQQTRDESEEEQKAMPMNQMNGGSNYGDRSPASSRPTMKANGYTSQEAKSPMDYGQHSISSTTTPSSYEAGPMGPSTSSQAPMAGYGSAQQMPMGSAATGYDGQEQQQQQQEPMSADTKGMQRPVMMMQPVMKSYGMSSPATMSPMMASVRMAPKMTSYGGDSTSSERPTDGKLMQQVMRVMRAKQVAMGGQGKAIYGAGDQQQNEAKDYGADSQGMQPNGMGYGTKSAPSPSDTQTQEQEQAGVKGLPSRGQPMNRPTMPMSMGMSYDSQDQQQQQMGSGGGIQDQQQQAADYGQGAADQYGAAPMGQAEPFAFDYKVEDEATGNNQYRKEESDKNGVVRGSYGYMDSNSGVYRHVEYVADENGFRANIKSNEPGLSDKATSGGQPQQQRPEIAGDRSTSGESMGTKSAPSEAAGYQPARGQSEMAPPSSSSSLGGSAALQQEPSKTSATMEDQMARQPVQMAAKMPQEQQQQQTGEEK